MASTPASSPGSVVIDANVLIAICASEKDKFHKAQDALNEYARSGWLFYAPGVVIGEVLYVLCGKLQNGTLTSTEHQKAIKSFQAQIKAILPPPNGDAALVSKAEELRSGYGCSRSADSIYLALAWELKQSVATELLTFDEDLEKQAGNNAPYSKDQLAAFEERLISLYPSQTMFRVALCDSWIFYFAGCCQNQVHHY